MMSALSFLHISLIFSMKPLVRLLNKSLVHIYKRINVDAILLNSQKLGDLDLPQRIEVEQVCHGFVRKILEFWRLFERAE
jgi:hypothetical protein